MVPTSEKRKYGNPLRAKTMPPVRCYMRCLTYSRVSAVDQSLDIQLETLAKFCASKNLTVVANLSEKISGASASARPEFQKLLDMAIRNEIDCVVVFKIDRFARSLVDCVNSIKTLNDHGVRFISVQDNLDTSNDSPTGRLLLHLLAVFADLELQTIRTRCRLGREAALKKGVQFGRKKQFNDSLIFNLREQGLSMREIANRVGCSKANVHKVLSERSVKNSSINTDSTGGQNASSKV